MTDKAKYTQIEVFGIPKKRGGWRGGGRPKESGKTTSSIRIPNELTELVNTLKAGFKDGNITIEDIENMLKSIKN